VGQSFACASLYVDSRAMGAKKTTERARYCLLKFWNCHKINYLALVEVVAEALI